MRPGAAMASTPLSVRSRSALSSSYLLGVCWTRVTLRTNPTAIAGQSPAGDTQTPRAEGSINFRRLLALARSTSGDSRWRAASALG
ncbi:protein of unknown function [Micropruina glycogenica]|uniref:Uncharacterized protein n=1 Tax=Micropruina glycogenica TaxID=75385 RepID=A0A2N9JF93_9ACTN|nr:protein of unknown function [Micropruina glycogenica]